MGVLTDPFVQNAFMQRALLAGILVAIATGVVGTLMVLRGMAFLGDALAHGVLPGIAAALLITCTTLIMCVIKKDLYGRGHGKFSGSLTSRASMSRQTTLPDLL